MALLGSTGPEGTGRNRNTALKLAALATAGKG